LTCGILLLDKPLGLSSSGATQRVRRLLRLDKAGHVGSLDPLATGMLPICLGEATKLAGEVLEGAKTYSFRVALGTRTATGDTEGEVVESRPVPVLERSALLAVLGRFVGDSLQVPPMYSALKRDGRPLYELARAGVTVERAPRPIRIDSLDLVGMGPDWLECRVVCGKGTYVRTLAEDIAAALGTVGHVARLRRESVEPFDPAGMTTLAELEAEHAAGRPPSLVAPDRAVGHLAEVQLDAGASRRIGMGQTVVLPPEELPNLESPSVGSPAEPPGADLTVRLYGPERLFLGLGAVGPGGRVRPKRLFVAAAPPPSAPETD
jgi:tRNA pseudouridine55 synthase